jgi:predicted nicotinamide N-methyase
MEALPPHLAWLKIPAQAKAEADEAADVTWTYGWPAGMRLSSELAELIDCRGKTVADFGCGRGHCGFSALALGAKRVVFADGNARAVSWIDSVISLNSLGDRANAHDHEWGQPIPGGPFDLILGGDILYRPEYFARLLGTIAGSLAPDGAALLSDPRQLLEPELSQQAHANDLSWDTERRALGYTLVRARPSHA